MRFLPTTLAVLAVALGAGCAQTRSTSMGAGPETVMCRDGAWVTAAKDCGNHSGVERDMSGPQTQK
jgi:hypothetical protein